MTVRTGRPDLAAYNESVGMSTAELVAALRSLLGAKLVAYIGGVKETRAVRQWAEGSRKIANPTDVERLRVAYRAARMINLKDNIQIVQTWFQGLNPFLDDVSPARLLRDGDVDTDGPRVIAAARQYVAVG
jgi:hypothetical protein